MPMSHPSAEPPDPFDHAVALHEAGRLSEAIELYRRITETQGEDSVVLELLGAALVATGDASEAIRHLDRSLAIDATSPTAWLHRGLAKGAMGNQASATHDLGKALALDPGCVQAAERLAIQAIERGTPEDAWEVLTRSLEVAPDASALRRLRAMASIRRGRLGDAEQDLDRLVVDRPADPIVLALLTQLRGAQGRTREAIGSARKALALDDRSPEAFQNLVTALVATGQSDDAEEALRLVEGVDAGLLSAAARARLRSLAELELGRVDEAADRMRRWVAEHPEDAEAWGALAAALRTCGRTPEAINAARRAFKLVPTSVSGAVELGRALMAAGDAEAAIEAFEQARRLGGCSVSVSLDLVAVLQQRGWLTRAIEVAEGAMGRGALVPEVGLALTSLLHEAGRHREAVELGERSFADQVVAAGLPSIHLFGLNYPSDLDEAWVKDAHVRLAARVGAGRRLATRSDRDEEKVLRIGVLSGDLKTHSVAWFLRPLLSGLDRDRLTVVAYSNTRSTDAMTDSLRRETQEWREITGQSDERAADVIRGDRIDVLIDLSGHTAHHRLGVFRRSPAPVAISWLGYPNTTGLPEIGWRLVDGVTDPPGAERFATEALLRIDPPFLCFDRDAVAVEAPRRPPRPLTFGSFNNTAKLSEQCLWLWSRVLAEVPGSRLLLKARPFEDEAFRRFTRERLARLGVAESRVELRGFSRHVADHHLAYADVDVALDAFPYHGTTTTCESLWNGVPVVSRIGKVHRARVGKTLLQAVGLPDLACEDDDAFVAVASSLAADAERREFLRLRLRDQMRESPLCDAPGFARRFETGVRHAWRSWCRGEAPRGVFVSVEP